MFPRLYAIVDLGCILRDGMTLAERLTASSRFARELAEGGVTLMQLRGKHTSARELLAHAREFRRVLPSAVKLIMNDRADLCLAAGFDGVHVGQDDLSPESVRAIIGPNRILGVSTHNPEQARLAAATSADYVAIGPVFSTASKENPDPIVGLEGVREARAAVGADRPLVAIGGVGQERARSVIEAGADSVAVIGGLLSSPKESAAHFLSVML